MIVNTWKMTEDSSMVLTLGADSSFTFREDLVAVAGKWSLSPDGRWLHLKNDKKEKDNTERNLEIKELTHEHMVLSDNGDPMVFVGSNK